MPVRVVGIGGISRSGKSSLTKALSTTLYNTIHITQDSYLINPISITDQYLGTIDNYENPKCYNMGKLIVDLTALIKALQALPTVLDYTIIVEGFMVYSNPNLVALLNKYVMITVPKEVCFQRRTATKPMYYADNQYFYEKYLWNGFYTFNTYLPKDAIIVDGTKQPQITYEIVKAYILK